MTGGVLLDTVYTLVGPATVRAKTSSPNSSIAAAKWTARAATIIASIESALARTYDVMSNV